MENFQQRCPDPDPVFKKCMDPDSNPVCPERLDPDLDPDPVNNRPDPQPCLEHMRIRWTVPFKKTRQVLIFLKILLVDRQAYLYIYVHIKKYALNQSPCKFYAPFAINIRPEEFNRAWMGSWQFSMIRHMITINRSAINYCGDR